MSKTNWNIVEAQRCLNMQGVVKTKMSSWYSGYLFISKFISNILSKQSAAQLAAHDFFISCLFMACDCFCDQGLSLVLQLEAKAYFLQDASRFLNDAIACWFILFQWINFGFDTKLKTCSWFHSAAIHFSSPVKLFQFILCLSHHLLLFGVVIQASWGWQITNGFKKNFIGSCSNMSLTLHRDLFIHLSCVATDAFPYSRDWSYSPRWNLQGIFYHKM